MKPPIIQFASADPQETLRGAAPRLVDEWRNVPSLWDVARSEVDRREEKFGQFIFAGISTPADMGERYHSGAGRIVTIPMRPMSLFESKESKGVISLADLFNGKAGVSALNGAMV